MTAIEIKTEIQKVLDNIPESSLSDVLDFLKELQSKPSEELSTANHLKKILLEDRALLEKLAQ
jgi:hypothetical protein